MMTVKNDFSQMPDVKLQDDRGYAGQRSGSGITFIELMVVLARRKRIIAAATGTGMLAAAIVSLLLPIRYTSTTTIMTPREAPSLTALLTNNSQLSNASLGSLASLTGPGMLMRNPNDLYIGFLGSRPVLDAIIDQFGLMKLYHSADRTAARVTLAQRTEILSQKSGLIAISVTDSDKKRAADMAAAYITQLRSLTQSIALSEASQRVLFYEGQLKRTKDDVVQAEFAFQQVQQKSGIVQVSAQTSAMIGGLAALRAQITAKEVEVHSLRSYSTDHNPQVELAESELGSLREQMTIMEQHNPSKRPFDMGLGDIPTASLEYLSAEHELLYRQTLFDLLLKLYDSARLDEAKEAAVIQTVEPAIEPDRRSSPKRKLIALCGLFAGFFIGCGIALLEPLLQFVNSNPDAARLLRDLKRELVIWKKSPRRNQPIQT
jgi:uncharacterized protein involved in exopolysaccharide biosynthesis